MQETNEIRDKVVLVGLNSPVLRKEEIADETTMEELSALVETAGLDWLENRDIPRADLERLLVDQLVAIMQTAGRHDPETGALFDRLSQEELST